MNHSNLSPALLFMILFNLLLVSCGNERSGGPVIVAGHLPGDSLYITSGTSLDFSGGAGGLINSYYAAVDAHLGGLLDTVNIKWYYSQEPGPFSDLVNQLISDFTKRLDLYASENPGIGKDFIALEKERIRHYWFYELNTYYDEYKAYTGTVPDLPADRCVVHDMQSVYEGNPPLA